MSAALKWDLYITLFHILASNLSGGLLLEPLKMDNMDKFLFTVDFLDALEIVMRQFEALCVHVLVKGGHYRSGVVGVLQTQRVAQLMDGHQEQVIPCDNVQGQLSCMLPLKYTLSTQTQNRLWEWLEKHSRDKPFNESWMEDKREKQPQYYQDTAI